MEGRRPKRPSQAKGAGPASERQPPEGELTPRQVRQFQAVIYAHYREHGRRLPWRETTDPYAILVSEFMLQQTQVARVLGKYSAFLREFPDFPSLAQAPLPKVLALWQGLGYNRRALALKACALEVQDRFGGRLPEAPEVLATLPGIGPATAGAVAAFAFGQPVPFIETNIRRVFLHCFFREADSVGDGKILPLVAQTLDRTQVRIWYYALMDYGVWLKTQVPNPNRRSACYRPQSPFPGSDRAVRGAILRALLPAARLSLAELAARIGQDKDRTARLAVDLEREGFLVRAGPHWQLASGRGPLG